jgi:hypothetical protein
MLKVLRNPDIFNCPTPVTHKMVVRFPHRLVEVHIASESKTIDESLIHKNIEVPVHVSKTHTGKLRTQFIVDPVGRNVITT